MHQSFTLPADVGHVEFSLVRARDVSESGLPPAAEPGSVKSEDGGFGVTFPSGVVLHVQMVSGDGPSRIGRIRVESCTIGEPFIILMSVRLANRTEPYFMIPAVLYGTNNADRGLVNNHPAGFGGEPKLAYRAGAIDREQIKSPHWHFRADHSAAPMVSANFDGHFVALGIRESSERPDGQWVYNSLGLWTDAVEGDTLTIVIGALNWPACIVGHELGAGPEVEPLSGNIAVGMTTEFMIHTGSAASRFAYEPVVEAWYEHLHESPRSGAPLEVAMRDVATAVVEDGISDQTGYFYMLFDTRGIDGNAPGTSDSEPRCMLAWAGVLQIARPLLQIGRLLNDSRIIDVASTMVDRAVNEAFNESLGLFNDVLRDGRWQFCSWWGDLGHTSLISGHACYLLMKMAQDDPSFHRWTDAAVRVLDNVSQYQRNDGRFPVGFSPTDGKPVSFIGFGGCFFVAPLLMSHRLFGDNNAGDAGRRALEHYWDEFTNLEWIGVDLDCRGAQDCGSSYALARALVEFHRQTRDSQALDRLGHVLHYACTYRFGHNTRHRCAPCDWSSSGSKVTSTHNVHLDAYGGEVLEDLQYYVDQTGDPYFRNRIEDSLAWARQAYNRKESEYGFGKTGWVTEQYYHTHDSYQDPEIDGGVWKAYFPWAAGSLLNAYALEARLGGEGSRFDS